jgi:DNA-binding beta-propeller fold protein YncE
MSRVVGGTAGRVVVILLVGLAILILLPPIAGLVLGLAEISLGNFERPTTLGYQGLDAGIVTLGWAASIGLTTSWLGARAGERLARRPPLFEAVLWTVPVLVAPAVLFDAWWLELGPDTWIGGWAARHAQVPLLRQSVLAIGLSTSALPLAVWGHAAMGADPSRSLRRLDHPSGWRRAAAWWRLEGWRVLRVAVLVTIVIGGLTVPFDLAQVRSIGFELRTLDTRGATSGTLLLAGWWSVPVAVLGAVLMTRRLPVARRHATGLASVSDRWDWASVAIGIALVSVPLMLLARRGWQTPLGDAWRLHGDAAIGTIWMAVMGGFVGAVMATGCAWLRAGGEGGGRMATLLVGGCAVLAFLPATLVASGVESVWNRPATAMIYDGPTAMMLAVAGRVSIVPAILGVLLVPRVGVLGGGPLAADAPRRLGDLLKAAHPTAVRAMICGGLAGGVLAAAEIPVTARLQPPGCPLLSTALLNAMHYQYVDSVLPIVLPVSLAAVPVAAILIAIVRLRRSAGVMSMLPLLVVGSVLLSGCVDTEPSENATSEVAPITADTIFGRPGNLDGRFDYPRAIALDPTGDRVYVVDKSARIQRFRLDGTFELSWSMPRFENGKPTGITVAPDGRVVVADTHEHRIAIFSPEGDLLETHGRMGREPGEFIYPTDVVAGPDGRWFVSEYGGNDRVQIFDADWNPLAAIGFAGETDEVNRPALSRPQSMVWDAIRGELFIADAIHHRIVVTDADGVLHRVLGGAGLDPGRFSYPYGLGMLPDGSVLVAEFGANRVQRIDPADGRCLSVMGGTGSEPGRLRYPWALDSVAGRMAVLDSGNSRVIIATPPPIGEGLADVSVSTTSSGRRSNDGERSQS